MKIYNKKNLMIEYVNEHNIEPDVYFAFKKYANQGGYAFSYLESFDNFFTQLKKLEIDGRYYVNEILIHEYRKPYMDIERLYDDEETYNNMRNKFLNNLLDDIIKVFKNKYDFDITRDDIYLTESSGNDQKSGKYKLSFHLVIHSEPRLCYYVSGNRGDSAAKHLIASLIEIDDEYKNFLDESVFNTDSQMRIIGSYKQANCDRCLIPIDPHKFKPIKNLTNKQKLKYLISYIGGVKLFRKLKTPIYELTTTPKKQMTHSSTTTVNTRDIFHKYAKIYHPTAEFIESNKGHVHAFKYSDKTEPCPISGELHDSNNFYLIETPKGVYLKCHSAKCKNKSKFVAHSTDIEEEEFIKNAIQINQQYLIMDGKLDKKTKDDVVKEKIFEWLNNDDIKTLAVRSPMGTGKSTLLKQIFNYSNEPEKTKEPPKKKKIIIFTHRQSLATQLSGQHKDFVNYLTHDGHLYEFDRVIVQIDSVGRVFLRNSSGVCYNKYDYAVIDEIESAMAHIYSPYLDKGNKSSRDIFNQIIKIISNCKKLIVLDADMGIRSRLFIEIFGKSIVINNKFKTPQRKFIITNDFEKFEESIFSDLKNGLKIFVASMSATFLETIVNKLTEKKIEHLIHTSKADDSLKRKLADVNNLWNKYQFVGISPCIDSAIDFNEIHFDKIYCYQQDGPQSASPRTLYQMVGRIRKCNNLEILSYYAGKCNISSPIYTYDNVLSHARYFETLNGVKLIQDYEMVSIDEGDHIKEVKVIKSISPYDQIYIHNYVEALNKNSGSFMTIFAKIVQKKNDLLEFDLAEKTVSPPKNGKKTILEKLLDIDASKYDLKNLINKQKKNKLTNIEKYAIDKLFFIKTFGLENVRNKKLPVYFEKFYNKQHVLRNMEYIFAFNFKDRANEIENYHELNVHNKTEIIIDFIDIILQGVNNKDNENNNEKDNKKNKKKDNENNEEKDNKTPNDTNIKRSLDYKKFSKPIIIPADIFEKNLFEIKEKSLYFKNEESSIMLFNGNKGATLANMIKKQDIENKKKEEAAKIKKEKEKKAAAKNKKEKEKKEAAKIKKEKEKKAGSKVTNKKVTNKKTNKKVTNKKTTNKKPTKKESPATKLKRQLIKVLQDKFRLFGITLKRDKKQYFNTVVDGKTKSVQKWNYSLSLDTELMDVLFKKYKIKTN